MSWKVHYKRTGGQGINYQPAPVIDHLPDSASRVQQKTSLRIKTLNEQMEIRLNIMLILQPLLATIHDFNDFGNYLKT